MVAAPAAASRWSACPATSRSTSPPLWQREIALAGAYAYGTETAGERRTFDLAFELVAAADLGRLVSAPPTPSPATTDAIAHAADAGSRGAVKIAFDLRDDGSETQTHVTPHLVRPEDPLSRPGFVLDVDRSTPPILFHHGESFRLEKLPAGRSRGSSTRPSRSRRSTDLDGAIRHALLNPLGDCEPLPDAAAPGMKLTIAFDDISLPLPPMRRPDIRQRVIEAVLDLAAAAGVDDVHLIAALALHRRMTEAELRHAVGDRVYDAFAPDGLLYNHDAEDPDDLAFLGDDRPGRGGRDQQAGRRERPARLREHQPRVDGRRPQEHRHRPGQLPQPPPPPQRAHHAALHARSWTATTRELHHSNWRMGEVVRNAGVKVFQIETTLNNDMFGSDGPMSVLQKREWEWTAARPGLVHRP